MQRKFERALAELGLTKAGGVNVACPDHFVGTIEHIIRTKHYSHRADVSERPSGIPCVILVLESPHKHEFTKDGRADVAKGPAAGSTGAQIRRYITEVIDPKEIEGHGLVLVNAVQFQCSRGLSPHRYRSEVFVKFWNGYGGRENFMVRMGQLTKPGDLVVNCCTQGGPAYELRHLVEESLASAECGLPKLVRRARRVHPSSWHDPDRKQFDWASGVWKR